MRRLVGLLALAGCAWATAHDLRRWQSDEALWTQAAATVDAPRPAVNLAAVRARHGDYLGAVLWDADAMDRSRRHPADAAIVADLVRGHLRWIDGVGHFPVCDRPPWASWC